MGRDNTYYFLEMGLAEESIRDFDGGSGHDYTINEEGVVGVADKKSTPTREGGGDEENG